jgi:hypothetical protein
VHEHERLPAHWARTSGLSWQRFRSYGGWNFRSKNFQHHLQTAFMTTWGYNFLRPYSTWKRSLIRILNEIGIQENVPGEFEVSPKSRPKPFFYTFQSSLIILNFFRFSIEIDPRDLEIFENSPKFSVFRQLCSNVSR